MTTEIKAGTIRQDYLAGCGILAELGYPDIFEMSLGATV